MTLLVGLKEINELKRSSKNEGSDKDIIVLDRAFNRNWERLTGCDRKEAHTGSSLRQDSPHDLGETRVLLSRDFYQASSGIERFLGIRQN